MSDENANLYADSPPTVSQLEIEHHFNNLTDAQKLYAHYISRASFEGTRIVLRQVSPESEGIYDLSIEVFRNVDGDWKKLSEKTGVSEENVKYWVEYSAQVLGNLGNYKSFGDSKFIPRIPKAELERLVACSPRAKELYASVGNAIYSTKPPEILVLGYPGAGHVSTYYPNSPDITEQEVNKIQDFMTSEKLYAENTRLQKISSNEYILLLASVDTSAPEGTKTEYILPDGAKLRLKYGDYSRELGKALVSLQGAEDNALNEQEKKMFAEYVKHFKTGSWAAFLESQKLWVKDTGPVVECNIGFIETYRDPRGVRAEWEGFAAIVNQEQTKKFGTLVTKAETFIPRLPWSKDFEKDHFQQPDFTSLEVLTFNGSGIPAGINIPNSEEIRGYIGFKNVSLGNVLSAKAPNEVITFTRDEDKELFDKLRGPAFEVQVGLHELLGHGTGKLLEETKKGEYNFDISNPPISPITNEPVKTWYKYGETWGGKFASVAASYEECRAECVAMALGGDKDILGIFGYEDDTEIKGDDVLYIEYLQMARAGLLALEYWSTEANRWGQSHMQARFSILKVLLNAGGDLVKLESSKPDFDDLVIHLDRTKIRSHGVPAVRDYLQKLHIYKTTADVQNGTKLYTDMTTPGADMLKYRDVVLRKKLPRKQFVQANTVLGEDGKVSLKVYEPSPEGLIRSFAERGV